MVNESTNKLTNKQNNDKVKESTNKVTQLSFGGEYMRIDRIKFVSEMMKRDLTQCKLAEISGVSRATIGYIKAGKSCSDEVGRKLAKALGVDVTEIIEQ